ncbi:response regulator transcription factor [Pseudomonas sp. M47T1]|uniref:response regulator transcription factor n=1 Tax=Pseudomonas sp. M47T1 TaxID=1179778 RepID=UPI000303AFBA|nr:response regulator transcription factor [Pseudomonas sp. M47T1]
MRILVIEDDATAAGYLARGLAESGHVADIADNGRDGLEMALEGIYDALIVDRKLPQLDGLALVRELRAEGVQLPILMLSALASTQQRVEGLQAGCDDYLVKPYAFVEVMARLYALLRTVGQAPSSGERLKVGELELDCAARTARRQGREIRLQYRESLLLAKLMRHSGEVVTRDMLLESAWDYEFDPNDNVIDKHIYRLRRKLDEGFQTSLIRTVMGAGYVLEEGSARS